QPRPRDQHAAHRELHQPSGVNPLMADRIDGYAQAIFDIARSEGSLETVENELFQFSQLFQGNEQLREKLTDQTLPVEKRQAIIDGTVRRRLEQLRESL